MQQTYHESAVCAGHYHAHENSRPPQNWGLEKLADVLCDSVALYPGEADRQGFNLESDTFFVTRQLRQFHAEHIGYSVHPGNFLKDLRCGRVVIKIVEKDESSK